MPNIPGSTWDKVKKKYVPPPGYVVPKDRKKLERERRKNQNEDARLKDPGPIDRRHAFEAARRYEAADQNYAVYSLYPGQPRCFIGYISDPTHAAVAAKFGGGNYSVQPFDRASNMPTGEPMNMNIDPTVYPPLLPGFQAQRPFSFNAGPLGLNSMFSGSAYGAQPFGAGSYEMAGGPPNNNAALKEAQEEADELEAENGQLKVRLAEKEREFKDLQEKFTAERERSLRSELEQKQLAQFAEMKALIQGNRKDPLDQLLEFKKVEAELNPSVGRGGAGEVMASLASLFDLVMKAKENFGGEAAGGGAAGGFLEVLKGLTPIIDKAMNNKSAPKESLLVDAKAVTVPDSKPAVNAEIKQIADPPKEEELEPPVREAADQLFNYLGTSGGAGVTPLAAGEWISSRKGPGWEKILETVRDEDPKDFIDIAKGRIPDAVSSDQGKAWMLEALTIAKERLKSQ